MQAIFEKWQPRILSIFIALMPLSFSIDQRIKALPTAVLFLIGLGAVIRFPQIWQSYRMARDALFGSLLLIVFVVFNVMFHRLGWRPLDRPAHILLYLVIAAVFTRPLRLRVIWSGFSASAIILGAISLIQHYALGIDRSYGLNGGASASIEFATILFALALVALVQLLNTRVFFMEKVLHIAAIIFSIIGALLTQSRGPLLAFVPMVFFILFLHVRRTRRWRWSLLVSASILACAGVVMFAMHDDIVTRFEAIGPEMTAPLPNGSGQGAVRERLEMWQAAWRAWTEHPFAGIGIDRFNDFLQNEIVMERSNPAIGKYNQPHNEYLDAAVTGGTPGLLILLLVFLLPLRFFIKNLKNADDEIIFSAYVGIAIIGLYMLCAVTDSVFYRIMTNSFYFFLVFGLSLLIGNQMLCQKKQPV